MATTKCAGLRNGMQVVAIERGLVFFLCGGCLEDEKWKDLKNFGTKYIIALTIMLS